MSRLCIAIAICALVQPSYQFYQNSGSVWTTSAFADYRSASGHDIFDVLHQKPVASEAGLSSCAAGNTDVIVFAGSYEEDSIITNRSSYGSQYRLQCEHECITNMSDVLPADVTPANSQSQLANGQNVIEDNLGKATYVLSLSADEALIGETTLLTLQVQVGSSSNSILLKVAKNSTVGDPSLEVEVGAETNHAKLSLKRPNQIVILTNNETGLEGVAILLNGEVISSVTDAHLTGLTFTSLSNVFMYRVTQWLVYDTILTTQDLFKLNNKEVKVEPGMRCNCPQDYPIFKRWPHHNDTLWRGTHCQSVGGENTTPRIQQKSYGLPFINDGDESTYWASAVNKYLNKLTFDLGARYQIFFSKISLITLPLYVVITKQRSSAHDEEVIYVISDNCASPLPAELPQSTPLVCENFTFLFHGNGSDARSRVAMLNWADKILYPDLINSNMKAFEQSLSAGVFEARYISVYFYGHAGAPSSSEYHIISELEVYGSCACAQHGVCIVSDGRKHVQHGVTVSPISVPVYSPYSFEQFAGYRCSCPAAYTAPYCEDCSPESHFLSDGICEPCNCGEGSAASSCNFIGSCTCTNDARAGTKPELADTKCRPFIHTLTPAFGPIAGGTEVIAEGAWLAGVQFIYFGSDKLYKQEKSNDTHLYVTTNKSAAGSVDVSINSYQPLSFDFKPNPNITIIGRIDVFTSGGVDIPVTGTSLDSIASPKILVNVICKSSKQQVKAVEGDCTVNSPEDMVCQSPDLTGVLDNVACAPLAAKKRRRKRQVDRYDTLYEFLIGFKLDGFEEFKNASETPWLEASAQLTIRPDPVIFLFDDDRRIRLVEETETQLEVKGRNLQSGATKEDYNITVGVGSCLLSFLYDRSFKCQLGSEMPAAGDDYIRNPNNTDEKLPSVVVTVGNIKVHVGYLARPVIPSTSPVIGIAVGVSVAVVILVAVVVIAIVCIKRKMHKVKEVQDRQRERSQRYVPGPMGKMTEDFLDAELMEALGDWLVPREKLDLGDALGQGQFGKVFLGELLDANGAREKVAVKTIKADLLRTDGNAVSNFLQEAILMKDFNHPNVLSLIAVIINEGNLPMVVTAYMSKGDLKRVLRDDKEDFTVGDLIHFGLQAANGMSYLAKRKFIHRDLAARNCMVNEDYFLKIADFGMSHDVYSDDYYCVQNRNKPLPVKWMAIENLEAGRYSVKSDVWSYGVLLWEIMTRGAAPYSDVNNCDIKSYLMLGRRLPAPEYCPVELYDLMSACWAHLGADRPHFSEISETLRMFLNEHSDYHRDNTKDIENNYYTEPAENDYVDETANNLPAPDYDVAMPVTQAPGNPTAADTQHVDLKGLDGSANKNNNSNTQLSGSSSSPLVSANEDSYLTPTPSVKQNAKFEDKPLKKPIPQVRSKGVSYKKRDGEISFGDARKKLRSVGNRLSREGMPEAVKNPYVY